MAMEGIKFDDGTGGFATNCFPVRTLHRQADEGGGAWLVGHRVEQRKKFKALLCTKPRTYEDIHHERKRAEKEGTNIVPPAANYAHETEPVDESTVLDGFHLMKVCHVDDPVDLCSVNISGQGLSETKEEDFALFDSVAYVNAAENILPLEPFHCFPIIRELELPLNGLRGIKVTEKHFPNLEMLDLSFNNLSPEDILPLGLLRKLTVLHLSGNGLNQLPSEMARPYRNTETYDKTERFPVLEVLMLDDNKLSDVSTFATLAGLRKLRHLNLSKNAIVTVPQLMLVEGRHVSQDGQSGTRKKPSKGKQKPGSSKKSSRRARSTDELRVNTCRTSPVDPAMHSGIAAHDDDDAAAGTDEMSFSDLANAQPAPANTTRDDDVTASSETVDMGGVPYREEEGKDGDGTDSHPVDVNQAQEPSGDVTGAEPQLPSIDVGVTDASCEQDGLGEADEDLQDLELGELDLNDLDAKIEAAQSLADSMGVGRRLPNSTRHGIPNGNPDSPSERPGDAFERPGYDGTTPLPPPFPQLRVLDLSHNKIYEEGDVLAVAAWPVVTHLIIHNNPLTLQRSGDPPMLRKFLQDELGIQVQRKQTAPIAKPALEIPQKQERKVNTYIPPVPKVNVDLLLAIEAAPRPPLPASATPPSTGRSLASANTGRSLEHYKPLPGIQDIPASRGEKARDTATSERPSSRDAQAFFMTQVDEQECKVNTQRPSDRLEKTKKERKIRRDVAAKPKSTTTENFKGYELLLEDDQVVFDEELPAATDVLGNLRSLQYTLGHPLLYRDTGGDLDQPQKPFRPNIKEPTPPRKPPKHRQQRVDEVLSGLKSRSTVVEENLAKVINNRRAYKKDFKDAKQLLSQVQRRYNAVRVDSMRSAHAQKQQEVAEDTLSEVQRQIQKLTTETAA